ncbi:hypothetical protein [uncultured Amnibacterium sp.]|uniref:hypothetical protein n=1 Tax=uncultured Amnibacterium sp. TaxID=1631851 RepID=UPI0035CB1D95
MSSATVTGAHLVGSVNLPTAEEVFGAVAEHLGEHITHIPDGEVGERYYWLQFQTRRFDRTPGLMRLGDTPYLIRGEFDQRPFALDGSVAAADLELPDLGYAEAAIGSYAAFARLQEAGRVAAGTRFQVSLPTPAAVVGVFFAPDVREEIEPVYTKALYAELARIADAIPHDALEIQWDTAVEFAWLEQAVLGGAVLVPWWDDVLEGVLTRLADAAAHVPADVPVGFHLCYGDVEEAHFVQPKDAGVLAQVVTGLLGRAPRPLAYIHLPVPIERTDAAFFAPLADVALPEGTDLYLGLIHHEDGVEGALARIDAAATAVPRFGVATECGLGRGPAERTAPLLDLHRQVLEAAR